MAKASGVLGFVEDVDAVSTTSPTGIARTITSPSEESDLPSWPRFGLLRLKNSEKTENGIGDGHAAKRLRTNAEVAKGVLEEDQVPLSQDPDARQEFLDSGILSQPVEFCLDSGMCQMIPEFQGGHSPNQMMITKSNVLVPRVEATSPSESGPLEYHLLYQEAQEAQEAQSLNSPKMKMNTAAPVAFVANAGEMEGPEGQVCLF
jgi:hypothetical protein